MNCIIQGNQRKVIFQTHFVRCSALFITLVGIHIIIYRNSNKKLKKV